jgi:hypothetical protein
LSGHVADKFSRIIVAISLSFIHLWRAVSANATVCSVISGFIAPMFTTAERTRKRGGMLGEQ